MLSGADGVLFSSCDRRRISNDDTTHFPHGHHTSQDDQIYEAVIPNSPCGRLHGEPRDRPFSQRGKGQDDARLPEHV
jgi:hypothetical protein